MNERTRYAEQPAEQHAEPFRVRNLALVAPRPVQKRALGVQATLIQKMFDAVDYAVMLIDTTGELLFSNVAARELVGADMGPGFVQQVLNDCPPEDYRAWQRAVLDCLAGQRQLLQLKGCQQRMLALTPVSDEGSGRVDMIMLSISRLSICSKEALASFAAMYRLTRSERDVLSALALGLSAEQIAVNRAVTEATVRTHIKNTLHKTGQSSLRRLQAQIAQLPPIRAVS